MVQIATVQIKKNTQKRTYSLYNATYMYKKKKNKQSTCRVNLGTHSISNSTFIALNLHLKTDSKHNKPKKKRTIIISLDIARVGTMGRNQKKEKLG